MGNTSLAARIDRTASARRHDKGLFARLVPGAQPILCTLLLVAGRLLEQVAPTAAVASYGLAYLARTVPAMLEVLRICAFRVSPPPSGNWRAPTWSQI